MKKFILISIIFITFLISVGVTYCYLPFQIKYKEDINFVEISIPYWLEGVWHNYGQSNTDNFIYWKFSNDTIVYQKGIHDNFKEVLNDKYAYYEKIICSSDNEYQISFIKEKDTVTYNFRLEKLDWTIYRALSYSVTMNGVEILPHCTILISEKDFLKLN